LGEKFIPHFPPPMVRVQKKGKGDKGDAPAGEEGPSLEQLMNRIAELEKDREDEAKQRSYMQLERDKINQFWEVTKKELEDMKAELRNKDRDMEDLEERHQVEIKVYKQKVKHLLYEHQSNLTTLKTDNEADLRQQLMEFKEHESKLLQDKRFLKKEQRGHEISNEKHVREIELKHANYVTHIKKRFDNKVKELQKNYQDKMRVLREAMELRRKQEVHEIDERKNDHIFELMEKHARAFSEIKNYYNDITHNNLDLIKMLKEDVNKYKLGVAEKEKKMNEIKAENKALKEPMEAAERKVRELEGKLQKYEKDQMSIKTTNERLAQVEKQLKNLDWDYEVQQQRLIEVQRERDELYEAFERNIYEVQQKAGMRSVLLERKLETLSEVLEKKEAKLAEVLAASNLDPQTLQRVNQKLEEVLDNKNQIIKALQYDIAKVCKAHNDLIRVYEAKLAEFGIPAEELGFRPLVTNTSTGPAGLVVGQ